MMGYSLVIIKMYVCMRSGAGYAGWHVLFIVTVPSLIIALHIAAREHSCILQFLTLRCCVAM